MPCFDGREIGKFSLVLLRLTPYNIYESTTQIYYKEVNMMLSEELKRRIRRESELRRQLQDVDERIRRELAAYHRTQEIIKDIRHIPKT